MRDGEPNKHFPSLPQRKRARGDLQTKAVHGITQGCGDSPSAVANLSDRAEVAAPRKGEAVVCGGQVLQPRLKKACDWLLARKLEVAQLWFENSPYGPTKIVNWRRNLIQWD
jgi:hypothetical protein